jgi:hypothetical protein
MATLVVDGGDLVVRLSPIEKLGAFRGDVRVPLTAIRFVSIEPRPWHELRKWRAVRIRPGTGIPGLAALGVLGFGADKAFAAVYGKRPAARIDLDTTAHFGHLLITVPDPEASMALIKAVGA